MQSAKTQIFLDAVCAEITRKRVCTAVRAELAAHVEDHMALLMEEYGMTAEEAEDATLRCMGDPALLGQHFNRVHCCWKPFVLRLAVFGFWIVMAIILLDLVYLLYLPK